MLSELQENLTRDPDGAAEAAPRGRDLRDRPVQPYSGTETNREIVASIGVQQVNGVIGGSGDGWSWSALVPVYELFQGRGRSGSPPTASTPTTTATG